VYSCREVSQVGLEGIKEGLEQLTKIKSVRLETHE